MKKLFTLLAAVILTVNVFTQSPEKMSYQAVVRNDKGEPVINTAVGMQISIVQGSAVGTKVYVETQTPNTNANGLVNIEIGNGIVESGDFTTIDWANGIYFIKTETDPTGGTDYSITGTSQLMSVPYALHAKTTESVPIGTQTGEMQYWNGADWVIVPAAIYEGSVLTSVGGVPTWKHKLQSGEVENPATGKVWMDRNLGASQVATSSTDEAAYGDLYQWGRATDGHEKRASLSSTATLSTSDTPDHGDFITTSSDPYNWRSPKNDNLWQGVNGVNNPCPSGYRLPTESEWEAERITWSSNNAAGAFASPLKLTVAGSARSGNSTLNVGFDGSYWASTIRGEVAFFLAFYNNDAFVTLNNRNLGLSVRCIKD